MKKAFALNNVEANSYPYMRNEKVLAANKVKVNSYPYMRNENICTKQG